MNSRLQSKKKPCWFYTLIKVEKRPARHTKPHRSEQFHFTGVDFHSPAWRKKNVSVLSRTSCFSCTWLTLIPSIGRVTSSKLFPSTMTPRTTGVQPWRVQGYACGFASFRWKRRSQIVFKERNCAEITRLKVRRQRNTDEEFSSCSGDSYRSQRGEPQLQGPSFDWCRIIRGRAGGSARCRVSVWCRKQPRRLTSNLCMDFFPSSCNGDENDQPPCSFCFAKEKKRKLNHDTICYDRCMLPFDLSVYHFGDALYHQWPKSIAMQKTAYPAPLFTPFFKTNVLASCQSSLSFLFSDNLDI